jgi:hypothetical protein
MKVMRVLIMALVLLGLSASAVGAMPPGQWVSGVTVANLSGDPATVEIRFYAQDGTEVLVFSAGLIAGNSAKTWYLPTGVSGLPTSFIGSALVASDMPIAAIVNTQLPSGTNPMRVGTSVGVASPSTVANVTQLLKNFEGWNSYCAVQNAGATAGNVTARFYNEAGTQVATDTRSIPALANSVFDLASMAAVPNGMLSAKFEGANPLAVVCNFYNSAADANSAQFHSYNGMAQGSSTLYIPRIVKNYYGYQSGLKIQNIGTEALAVTVTYNFGGTAYVQVSPSIDPGQSWGPYMGSASQLPASMSGVSGSGSAVVQINDPTGGKSIIATVNEDNRVNPAGRGVTYEAALPSDATSTVVFPQVTSEYYGYSSGIQVMKTSAGSLSCTANYSASGPVSAFSVPFSLTDAMPSWSQFAPDAAGMLPGISNDNYNGSVTVTCPGGTIIGISNLSFRYDRDTRYGNLLGDSFTTARGINK